jgi:hypothetical protein
MRLIVQAELEGTLRGWDGATVFALANGETWRQSAFRARTLHVCDPMVRIWAAGMHYWLEIEGACEILPVTRVT